MYSEILETLRTLEDLELLESEIDTLLSSFYEEKGQGYENALKTEVRAWVADLIRRLQPASGISKEEYLKNLQVELKKLKVLQITISFEPTEGNIERIHNWILNNAGRNLILEVNRNPNIVGGAIVVYEGEYRDYSLRKKFLDVFSKHKDEFLKFLS